MDGKLFGATCFTFCIQSLCHRDGASLRVNANQQAVTNVWGGMEQRGCGGTARVVEWRKGTLAGKSNSRCSLARLHSAALACTSQLRQ